MLFNWAIDWLQEEGIVLNYRPEKLGKTDSYMDKWILSFTQSLIKFVRQEMQGKKTHIEL